MNLLRILNLNMKVKVTVNLKVIYRKSLKDFLINFKEKYASFYNSDDLDDILDKGKEKAQKASFKTLKNGKSNGLRSKKIILYNIQIMPRK